MGPEEVFVRMFGLYGGLLVVGWGIGYAIRLAKEATGYA